jgi:hypothetical protein
LETRDYKVERAKRKRHWSSEENRRKLGKEVAAGRRRDKAVAVWNNGKEWNKMSSNQESRWIMMERTHGSVE